jgi:hypothetical protein
MAKIIAISTSTADPALPVAGREEERLIYR